MLVFLYCFLYQWEAWASACEYNGGFVAKFLREDVVGSQNEVNPLFLAVPVREEHGEPFGVAGLEFGYECLVAL